VQELLDDVLTQEPSEVMFLGKKRKIGWLRYGTIRKFTHISLKEKKNEGKKNSKLTAILLLNNKWKILFFYWFVWRWLYYIVDVDIVEELRVLDCAKKKVPSVPSFLYTILSTGIADTRMTITAEDVEASQAGQATEQPFPSQRNTTSSLNENME
jgi:hypothetical protein